jgi:biopolymer transport protein TolR
MALSANDAFAAGGRRGRRRGRRGRGALSEINVTPLVDVMMVLLIIFMISAPLLTVGVPIELPKTSAGALNDQNQPISVSIRRDGAIFLGEDEIPYSALSDRATALAAGELARPVYVRADGAAQYAIVAQVMAGLSSSGFTRINLITDTGGPAPAPSPDKPAASDAAG